MNIKITDFIKNRHILVGFSFVLVFDIYLLALAAPIGISNPIFGPTDDNAQIEFLGDLSLVENEITTCNSATFHPVSVSCTVGKKVVGGSCHGKGVSWIYGCQNNNSTSDHTSWDCSCKCSAGTLVAQAICAKAP